jgi:predicted nucleic acid-binding protein
MARYLLDTSAIIDLSKQYEPAYSLIPGLHESGDELGVCAINVAEFYAGLEGRELPDWDEFFAALTYWATSRAAAVQAGRWHMSMPKGECSLRPVTP